MQRGAAARVPHGLPYATGRRLAAVLLDAVRNLEGERRRRRFRPARRQAAHVPEGDAARSRVCRGHRVRDGRRSRARRLSEVGPRDRLPLGRVDALGGGPGRTPGLLGVHARKRVRVGRTDVHQGGRRRPLALSQVRARERMSVARADVRRRRGGRTPRLSEVCPRIRMSVGRTHVFSGGHAGPTGVSRVRPPKRMSLGQRLHRSPVHQSAMSRIRVQRRMSELLVDDRRRLLLV